MKFLEEVNIYKLTKHDPNMDAKNMRGWKQNLAMFVAMSIFVPQKSGGEFFFHHPSSLGRTCIPSNLPQNTRGGVLLADIAFNRLAAQNLD